MPRPDNLPLSSILQGYRLRALFGTASNIAAAGVTQQERKNLILNLFFGDLIR
jgi:hypothetical protein